MSKRIEVRDLNVFYSKFKAVEDVNITIEPRTVTAFIGPSGCGKSTFLRTLNRMHEVIPGAYVDGEVLIDGNDLYSPGVDPVLVRRQVGMVFQRPNPFPTMSIRDNVLAGVRLNNRRMSKGDQDSLVEKSLQGANLWNEVKDRLDKPGSGLSGGQQQRLCIARAIAVSPDVVLMDEPCSALDPISTLAIEDLIEELKQEYTIVIVTHNMQQASRVSDKTAFFNIAGTGKPGKLIEYDDTATMFSKPSVQATEDYVSGRPRLSSYRWSRQALGRATIGSVVGWSEPPVGSTVMPTTSPGDISPFSTWVTAESVVVSNVPAGTAPSSPMYQSSYVRSPGSEVRPSATIALRCSSFDHTRVAVPPVLTSATVRWKSGAA
jgi:phosphate transport system ATP-binding protein